MCETIGRNPDPGYWLRVCVAVWIMAITVVLLGYAVLGYVFLRFLAWLILAIVALLFRVDNPIVWELPKVPELVEVVVLDDSESMGSFEVADVPVEIDDALPDLTPPKPIRVALTAPPPEAFLGEVVRSSKPLSVLESTSDRNVALLGILGSFSSDDGSVYDVLSSGGVGSDGGGLGGIEGGVVGGVVGGTASSAGPRKVASSALEFERRPMPAALPVTERLVCKATLQFDERGEVEVRGLRGCGEHAPTVRASLLDWRIRPHLVDGVPVPVRTEVALAFVP